jgi:hypothetical protein
MGDHAMSTYALLDVTKNVLERLLHVVVLEVLACELLLELDVLAVHLRERLPGLLCAARKCDSWAQAEHASAERVWPCGCAHGRTE